MINILIADDHALMRAGLKRILKDEPDIKVIGEASNGFEVLELARKEKIDFIVLDLTMPGKNGLEIIKELKQINKNLFILILSMHPEDRFAVRALKSGASGYMTKESAPDELVNAIRKIIAGRKYISSALAEKLASEFGEDTGKLPHESLSDREYEVFIMIASGKKITEIATELTLSVPTINTYRSRIFDKMRLKSNVDLTHYAMINKLID
jgi:two-component system invasion response regulator UvrY